MQTFLPYPDYAESAACLDRQRLGKQRVETLQLLNVLHADAGGWVNHPAARMWRGHEGSLIHYGLAICNAWTSRGYRDTCAEKIFDKLKLFPHTSVSPPVWLGDEKFHASHRSNLLRKNADFYGLYGWTESDSLPYVWPV